MANKRMKDFIKELEENALTSFWRFIKTKDTVWSTRFDTLIVCLAHAQNKDPNHVFEEFMQKYELLPSKFTEKEVQKAVDTYDYDNLETTAGYDPNKDEDKPKA